MPRYYFRFDGDDDDDGVEFADDAAACEAARDMFGQAIREGEVENGSNLVVRDASGRRVATFAFSAEQ